MFTIYQKTLKQKALKEIGDIKPGVWVHVVDPSEEELALLEETYRFDHGTLVDAIDLYEVPRVEREDDILYIITRVPSRSRHDLSTVPFTVCVHPEMVLSIVSENLSLITQFTKNAEDTATTQKLKFVILLLSEINKSYVKSVTSIRKEVNRIRVRADHVTDQDIIRFVDLENTLNEYLNALIPMSLMYKRLTSGRLIQIFEEDKELIEDLELEAEQLIDGAKAILRTIVNVREAYSVVATNRLNQVIKLLTTLTIFLTIPTIVTSFFGMNVALPFEESPFAAGYIVLGTLLFVSAIILFLKVRKLL